MATTKKTGVDYTTPEVSSASKADVARMKARGGFEKVPIRGAGTSTPSVRLKSGPWQQEPPFLPPTTGARKKKG